MINSLTHSLTHIRAQISLKLEQRVRDLRTAFRARRALERDLEAAWAELEEIRTHCSELARNLEQSRRVQHGLIAQLRREQAGHGAALAEIESLRARIGSPERISA